MKTIKLAIIGYGNAAKAFSKLLIQKEAEFQNLGFEIRISLATTQSRGSVSHKEGFTPNELLSYIEAQGNFHKHPQYTPKNSLELIENEAFDILVELSTLNIHSGEPAISHIRKALERGAHVITANKGPIAWAHKELQTLADENALQFLYETTVMDGTPIFNLVKDTLPLCKVTEIRGILNTTTNFILGHLAQGEALDEIMNEGRRRGFVEADPSLDVDGWDAAAKLTALMNVLMNADMKPTDVKREGISRITAEDLKSAKTKGKTIKLICRGSIENGKPVAEVSPQFVDQNALYAGIDETSSVVTIVTDLMGAISVVEHNPEIEQTGFGVLSDLVRILKWIKSRP